MVEILVYLAHNIHRTYIHACMHRDIHVHMYAKNLNMVETSVTSQDWDSNKKNLFIYVCYLEYKENIS